MCMYIYIYIIMIIIMILTISLTAIIVLSIVVVVVIIVIVIEPPRRSRDAPVCTLSEELHAAEGDTRAAVAAWSESSS